MATAKRSPRSFGVQLRVSLEQGVAIGPGKAALLEGVRETGSIAAAGRRMGMSYKRAWYLVDSMNACFRAPVVEAVKGGAAGGGARLTALGEEVLATYRRMEARSSRAVASDLRSLAGLVRRGRRKP